MRKHVNPSEITVMASAGEAWKSLLLVTLERTLCWWHVKRHSWQWCIRHSVHSVKRLASGKASSCIKQAKTDWSLVQLSGLPFPFKPFNSRENQGKPFNSRENQQGKQTLNEDNDDETYSQGFQSAWDYSRGHMPKVMQWNWIQSHMVGKQTS